nr:uncharacterized protein LOC109157428 [Ipomoea trifida]
MLRVYNTRGKLTSSHTQSDDEESSIGMMVDPTLDGVESGAIFSPSRAAPPQVITINSPDHARVDRPFGLPGSPSIEYDPHDPLFARGYNGTSRPRPLRPYHPDHIDFICRGVREMVPALTRFWMDSCPMDALSSHLVGDLMNAIGLQQRLQEASQDYVASEEALRELGERHQQLQVTHEATLKELDALKTTLKEFDALKTAHTALQHAHSTLQGEHEKQQVAHTRALEHAIEDWQGTEDFSRAVDDYACSRMPGLLRYWLSSPDRSGLAMVDAMSGWHDAQDYQAYLGPPLVQREMQDQLYGKLRRRFTSFSIAGWKLPKYLPLRRPPASVMPASTTTPADGFLMSPERAEGTSSVALPLDPVGGSGAARSVDPSLSLHFTSGSGFSGSAAGSVAPLLNGVNNPYPKFPTSDAAYKLCAAKSSSHAGTASLGFILSEPQLSNRPSWNNDQNNKAGNYNQALENCKAVYEKNQSTNNLLLFGAIYYQLNDFDMCIAKNEEAIRILCDGNTALVNILGAAVKLFTTRCAIEELKSILGASYSESLEAARSLLTARYDLLYLKLWSFFVMDVIGLPGFDSMPSALDMLSKHECASYCIRYWEEPI